MASVRNRRTVASEREETEDTNKKLVAERTERIISKIHAVIWVSLSIALIYFTDFFSLLASDKINRYLAFSASYSEIFLFPLHRWALYFSIFCITVVIGIFLYLAFWLPIVKKINIPWDIYCPNMIPTASAFSGLWFISSTITFWPVWGMLSPLFMGFLCMGLIFSAHFIPWPA